MKTVTLGQVADAIEANGLEQYTGWYFDSMTTPSQACAIGMGAINLSIDAASLEKKLNLFFPFVDDKTTYPLGAYITRLNDDDKLTFKEIADFIREHFSDKLDLEFIVHEWEYKPLWGVKDAGN